LRIETIWVSVNFDVFMKPPGLEIARKLQFRILYLMGKLTEVSSSWWQTHSEAQPLKIRSPHHFWQGLRSKACRRLLVYRRKHFKNNTTRVAKKVQNQKKVFWHQNNPLSSRAFDVSAVLN